jgi:hypothetical protein
MQNMLSKSNLWCQELFQGRHLSNIARLFFSNCRRSAKDIEKYIHYIWCLAITLQCDTGRRRIMQYIEHARYLVSNTQWHNEK